MVRESVSQGAGGQQQHVFKVMLRGSSPCLLKGYVGAEAYDTSGSPLHLALVRDTSSSPEKVVLTSADRGEFTISSGHPGADNCKSATTLRVTPPDETNTVPVPVTGFGVCGSSYVTALTLG